MSLTKAIQRSAPARRTEALDVPRTFIAFCAWLGVALTPGQAELARVAFDGAVPVDDGIAREIFGADVPVGHHRVVAAVCGARAGKSYVLVALRLVWGMLVRDLSSLAPGQRAVAMIVAPNEKLRREVLNYALGALKSKPGLEALLTREMTDMFEITRPDGKKVYFEGGVATAGGYGARGRSFTDFALDECAFFRDSSFKINDEEIFRAGSARVLPGGQVIVASTPWATAGLLYQLWKDRPDGTIVAHAPTLRLRDTKDTREYVEREMARDQDNAAREFGAKFMTTGTTVFFEAASIESALTDEPFVLQPDDLVAAGGDFGFRSDSSALIMVAIRGNMLHVFDGAEERPTADAPLKPSTTVKVFAQKIAGRCKTLMADQHYRETIVEHLDAQGLAYIPAPVVPAETYVRARMVLREVKLKIHPLPFRERLVQQMREVHGKPTSGGGMSIQHPRWATGGHGDICEALVLAVWQLYGDAVPGPKPEIGTSEWEAAQKKARMEHFKHLDERPHWRAAGGSQDRGRAVGGRRGRW